MPLDMKRKRNVFHRNDIAHRKNEICCISRRQNFNIACPNSKSREEIHLLWRLWAKVIVAFGFDFCFADKLPTLDMILAESKQLPDLTVMSDNTLFKWCKKTGALKKCKCINDLMLMLYLQSATLWKKTLAQVFSNKFSEFFQHATSLKMKLQHRSFLVNFEKLSYSTRPGLSNDTKFTNLF